MGSGQLTTTTALHGSQPPAQSATGPACNIAARGCKNIPSARMSGVTFSIIAETPNKESAKGAR